MPPYSLTNFEIQKYYQNERKFNGAYLRKSLPKIKDGPYLINLDDFKSIGIRWIALYMNDNNGRTYYKISYFDNFGVEHILKYS